MISPFTGGNTAQPPTAFPDPSPDDVDAVITKLAAGQWQDFTTAETAVAKWLVGWDAQRQEEVAAALARRKDGWDGVL